MARTELRCDAPKEYSYPDFTHYTGKCGKLLVRSPELGERVQWLTPNENTGEVWLVDHHRHLALVWVHRIDGVDMVPAIPGAYESQTIAWTALRPCNGEPVR